MSSIRLLIVSGILLFSSSASFADTTSVSGSDANQASERRPASHAPRAGRFFGQVKISNDGKLISRVHKGKTTTYSYANGRRTQSQKSTGEISDYQYSDSGKLRLISSNRGRLIHWDWTNPNETLRSITSDSGTELSFIRNQQGLLKSVSLQTKTGLVLDLSSKVRNLPKTHGAAPKLIGDDDTIDWDDPEVWDAIFDDVDDYDEYDALDDDGEIGCEESASITATPFGRPPRVSDKVSKLIGVVPMASGSCPVPPSYTSEDCINDICEPEYNDDVAYCRDTPGVADRWRALCYGDAMARFGECGNECRRAYP